MKEPISEEPKLVREEVFSINLEEPDPREADVLNEAVVAPKLKKPRQKRTKRAFSRLHRRPAFQ